MERLPNWSNGLWCVIREYRKTKFEYGHHDCCLFWARCIDAMTGSNYTVELMSSYSNVREAVKFLRAEGGMEAAITRRVGTPVDGCMARRGDGCLIDRHTVGVCVGAFTLVLTPRIGLQTYALSNTKKHWRIG